MTANQPLAYGRRTPKKHPSLKLARLLTPTLSASLQSTPPHPLAQDNLSTPALRTNPWQMLGNDKAGDCVAVTWANFKRVITSALSLTGQTIYPTQDEVWAIYKTQNPGFVPGSGPHGYESNDDQGMDIQTLLEHLQQTGEIIAFAAVDYTNLDEVKAALSIFGGLWTGINVFSNNEDEFDSGKPWTLPTSARDQNLGGHSVLSGGYSQSSSSDMTFITWATETAFADKYITSGGVEEAWVVIWPQMLGSKEFAANIDLSTLAADYTALTGKTLPLPAPQPAPSPSPTPAPTKTVTWPSDVLDPWLKEKHTGETKKVATALTALRKEING